QRLDSSVFDARRRAEAKTKIENEQEITYIEPFLFGNKVAFQTSLSHSFKRLYSFDADIFKFSMLGSKDFSKRFSGSLKYQLEGISQSDSTDEKDSGFFRIGSVTPSISYDLRNNKIRPTSGYQTSITSEFANLYFYSMDKE